MQSLFHVLFAVLLSFSISCSHTSKKEALRPPQFREFKLSNGLNVVIAEDKKLPLVSVTLLINTGASADPIGKTGLTYLTSGLLDKGTIEKSADDVAEAFAQLGTSFSEDVNRDFMTFSTESLQSNQEKLIELFAEVLTEPRFDAKEFSLLQKRTVASIQTSFDDPPSVADFVMDQEMMQDYIYARPVSGTLEDVQKIKLTEVKKQYSKMFTPAQSTLVMIGNWNPDVIANLEKIFSGWKVQGAGGAALAAKTVYPDVQPKNILVTNPDLKQVQIRLGHKGIARNHKDYWSLQVANVILGGNFTSRLMTEVRVKRGLTYTISSRFGTGVYQGSYSVSTFTRLDKVGETIQATRSVIDTFKKAGVRQDEVNRAKNYLKGHLIRSYENPEDIVMGILRMRLYGLPAEEVTEVLDRVNAVNLETVNAAIAKHWHPDQLLTLSYAPAATLEQLKVLGPVEVRPVKEYLLK